MIGVTIGIGDWEPIARRAAKRMEEMTGLKCEVIERVGHYGACHPSWLKCFICCEFTGEDSFMVFDADIICLRKWNPVELFTLFERRFIAVPDENSYRVMTECQQFRLPISDWYVNGGLTIFGREHQPIWQETWRHHPKYGRWLEQTALNSALFQSGIEVVRLPRAYNTLAHKGQLKEHPVYPIINLHCCSCGSAEKVAECQDKFMV